MVIPARSRMPEDSRGQFHSSPKYKIIIGLQLESIYIYILCFDFDAKCMYIQRCQNSIIKNCDLF